MRNARVLWLTGLSGSGKSTLAELLSRTLASEGRQVRVLDGDALRAAGSRDLGFSPADILENGRRMIALCRELRSAHDALIVAMISPFHETRDAARVAFAPAFDEIHLDVPVAALETRDVKGLYRRARAGEISPMIGMTPELPYETPRAPELVLNTFIDTPEESLRRVLRHLAAAEAAR